MSYLNNTRQLGEQLAKFTGKMSSSFNNVKLTKWQLALIIGTPIVFGVGIYLYKNSNTSKLSEGKNCKNVENGSDKNKQNANKEFEKKSKENALDIDKTPLKEATIYKNDGNACYRSGKYAEAITFYDKAIEKCPKENSGDLAIFYQNRAAAYEMLKKWSSVKEDCTRSLELNSRYAKAYFRRAKAYEATNELLECLDDVTATCILEMFQNNNTIMYADRILKKTGRDDAERGMRERKMVLPSKSFLSTYLRSFVADPLQLLKLPDIITNDAARGFVRAKIALDEENYDDIIQACTEEIESSEAEAQYKSEALLLRGTFLMLSGCFNESRQDLDELINNVDADASLRAYAYIKRASLHIQMEKKDEGLIDFEAAEILKPDSPDIYHQRAQIYILLDQLPEALEEFEKTVKMVPNHAMAYVQKCYAEYRLSLISQDHMRLMMVMNEFKNAIEKFPDCVECYSLMAQVLSDQQQFLQADQFYGKAIKMAPENASLYVHRGIMLLQWKGDIEQAINLMNRALEVDDKCELAYETLGTVEVQRANLDRAVELFEKAIKLSKSQSEMCHLYALRNAAVAQINVTRRLGIDMSTISTLAQSGMASGALPAVN